MERSLNAPSNFNLLINLLLIACGVGRVYPLNQGIVMSVLIRRGGKRTFQYTIMIVGSSGLGKSTFVNSLFQKQIIPERSVEDPNESHLPRSMGIEVYSFETDEENCRLSINIVDTPGFGDSPRTASQFDEILAYIELQYDHFLQEETRIRRNPKFVDSRVHLVLYFLPPTGSPRMRPIDIEFMRRIGKRCNVLPVIGKADGLTPNELSEMRRNIKQQISDLKLPIYNFPVDPEEDDEQLIAMNTELREQLPFAIVSSTNSDLSGIRSRTYPWGRVEIENPLHSDFSKLRQVLFETHLDDWKDITNNHLYEAYRTEALLQSTTDGGNTVTEAQLLGS